MNLLQQINTQLTKKDHKNLAQQLINKAISQDHSHITQVFDLFNTKLKEKDIKNTEKKMSQLYILKILKLILISQQPFPIKYLQ